MSNTGDDQPQVGGFTPVDDDGSSPPTHLREVAGPVPTVPNLPPPTLPAAAPAGGFEPLEEPTPTVGEPFAGPAVSSGSSGGFTPEPAVVERPPAPSPAAPAAAPQPRGKRGLLITLLITWASLATMVAAWLWYHRPEEKSPLENLPDDGLYDTGGIVSPLENLSSREIFNLGDRKRIGNIEVRPVKIEQRTVRLLPDKLESAPVLVLHLHIKNVSQSQTFHPTDPKFLYPDMNKKLQGLTAFNRRGYTYSFIHPQSGPGNSLIFCFDLAYELNYSIQGQKFPKLGPGEEADVIIVSEEDAGEWIQQPMLWRVKLRKGKAASGKCVATVIGVRFDKADIANNT